MSVGGASATPAAASSSKADIRSTFASTDRLKAELLWTLQTVAKHQSYHSNDDIGALFTLMFPDSATAQGFSCGENKTAYLAKYRLGPFIKQKLVAQVGTDMYVLMFDESLNTTTKSKQLDVHIRFWVTDEAGTHVISRYLGPQFLGHSTADDLLVHFKVGLHVLFTCYRVLLVQL